MHGPAEAREYVCLQHQQLSRLQATTIRGYPGWPRVASLLAELERIPIGCGRHEETDMTRIKHVLLCVMRLVLVVAAPRFAFSQATRDQEHNNEL
jgi:hypothetical protein